MRRIVSFLFILLLILLLPIVSMAVNTSVDLYLNGQKIHTAIPPKVKDSHTYVPLQFMAQDLGVETIWNASQNKASLEHNDLFLEFYTDQSLARVNGMQVELQAKPFLFEGNMYIPLQFVGEHLGIKVSWDPLTQSISIYKKDNTFLSSKELFETKPTEDTTILPPDIFEEHVKPHGQLSKIRSIESVNNQVIVQLDTAITPKSFYLDNPHRFVMDLPFSTFANH